MLRSQASLKELSSIFWKTNFTGIFSKEMFPLEYTNELSEVFSNNSRFVGLFKPKL